MYQNFCSDSCQTCEFEDRDFYGLYLVTGHCENGVPIGEWILTQRFGGNRTFCNFKNGQLNGVYKKFYKDGKVEFEGVFEKGIPIGQFKEHHDKIDRYITGAYDSLFKRQGEWISYFQDSIVMEYRYYEHGIAQNKWTEFYRSGMPSKITHYRDNKVVDTTFYFWENGNVQAFKPYNENSQLHGALTNYFENGKLKGTVDYQNGKVLGKQKLYYPNGNPELDGTIGEYGGEGLWIRYSPKGDTLSIFEYQRGVIVDTLYLNERN